MRDIITLSCNECKMRNYTTKKNKRLHPDRVPPIAMEEGLRFAIREGGRTVGAGVVAKIHE